MHDLPGVWSRTPQTAEDFALKYETRAYKSVHQMVKENKTDLVIICTPHMFINNLQLRLLKLCKRIGRETLASDLKDAMRS